MERLLRIRKFIIWCAVYRTEMLLFSSFLSLFMQCGIQIDSLILISYLYKSIFLFTLRFSGFFSGSFFSSFFLFQFYLYFKTSSVHKIHPQNVQTSILYTSLHYKDPKSGPAQLQRAIAALKPVCSPWKRVHVL